MLRDFLESMSGIDPVDFERQESSGRFAPVDVEPDPSVPADRGPDGEFVSPQRDEIGSFGRLGDGGLFRDTETHAQATGTELPKNASRQQARDPFDRVSEGDRVEIQQQFTSGQKTTTATVTNTGTISKGSPLAGNERELDAFSVEYEGDSPLPSVYEDNQTDSFDEEYFENENTGFSIL